MDTKLKKYKTILGSDKIEKWIHYFQIASVSISVVGIVVFHFAFGHLWESQTYFYESQDQEIWHEMWIDIHSDFLNSQAFENIVIEDVDMVLRQVEMNASFTYYVVFDNETIQTNATTNDLKQIRDQAYIGLKTDIETVVIDPGSQYFNSYRIVDQFRRTIKNYNLYVGSTVDQGGNQPQIKMMMLAYPKDYIKSMIQFYDDKVVSIKDALQIGSIVSTSLLILFITNIALLCFLLMRSILLPVSKLKRHKYDHIPIECILLFILMIMNHFNIAFVFLSRMIERPEPTATNLSFIFNSLLVIYLFFRKYKFDTAVDDIWLRKLLYSKKVFINSTYTNLQKNNKVLIVLVAFAFSVLLINLMNNELDNAFICLILFIFSSILLNKNTIKLRKTLHQFIQEQVNENVKAEKLKIELVTNVSHDLKTPLTSMIAYLDLLKDEEMSHEAKGYVHVIERKSNQLKGIIGDLFDLAKANSGNTTLDIQELDFKKLIIQTLDDFEESLKQDKLVKLDLAVDTLFIHTDNVYMYRIIQNVMDNAYKYSLDGSRIFISLNREGVFTIQNTSNHYLDCSVEEILERFKRGDEARTSEGNGLGLSIAKSFTEVLGGVFTLTIEADQFIVKIDMSQCLSEKVIDNK